MSNQIFEDIYTYFINKFFYYSKILINYSQYLFMDKIPTDGLEIPKPHNFNPTAPVLPVPTGRIHLEVPVSTTPVFTAPVIPVPTGRIHLDVPVTTAPVITAPVSIDHVPVRTASPDCTVCYEHVCCKHDLFSESPTSVTTAPVTTAPVTTAPVTTAPVTTAPVTTAPVTTAPATAAPATAAPVTTAPATTAPVTTEPVPVGFMRIEPGYHSLDPNDLTKKTMVITPRLVKLYGIAAPATIMSSEGIITLAPVTTAQVPAGTMVYGLGAKALTLVQDPAGTYRLSTTVPAPAPADNDQRKTTQDFANIVDKKIFSKKLKQKVSTSTTTPSTPIAVSTQNSLGETLIFNKLKAFVATDKITPEEATDILTTFTTELFTMVKHEKDVCKNSTVEKTCACGTVGNNAHDIDDSVVY